MKHTFRNSLLAPLCWIFVFSFPIIVGIGIHLAFPGLPGFVPWLVGGIVLTCGILTIDWLWRGMTWLVDEHQTMVQSAKSDEERVANFLNVVLTAYSVKCSSLMRQWPPSTNNPLILEALSLLKECADDLQDTFDRRKIEEHSERLHGIMRSLRYER